MSRSIIAPGTENCGCCEAIEARTPQAIDNRAGLSAIGYRIGEYAQFRDSMIAGLSSSEYHEPTGETTTDSTYPLAGLRSRDTDDFTIGLIDAVACAADVLTFYQERIANESYLRTATERVSLQEMARLVGYRLRPGVAAETWLALALEAPRTPPAGISRDPGAFVTGIPTSLTLPSGLQVQSVPGPDEKPQTFETVEEIQARPEWNAIRPWLSAPNAPGVGATETWVTGVSNNLNVGDALVFVDRRPVAGPGTNWDFRLIDSVKVDAANARTHVTWQLGLVNVSVRADGTPPPPVYVLRKHVGVFGSNAPMWKSMSDSFRKAYRGDVEDPDDWPQFTIGAGTIRDVDLDAGHDDIKPGGLVILTRIWLPSDDFQALTELASIDSALIDTPTLSQKAVTHLCRIVSAVAVSRAEFAISGKVTRLRLDEDLTRFRDHPRETDVYAQSEPLTIAEYPVVDVIDGDSLPLAVPAANLTAGRRIIVIGNRMGDGQTGVDNGKRVVHEATLVSITSNGGNAVLTINPRLPFALKRDTVVVHANVALATHGETGAQILGSGDASRSFQRFQLKRLPLTYRGASNETGADSELTVRIGNIEWTERPTLFDATPNDRAYTIDVDEQGKAWVVFGDGVRGARLPSGVNNVRARYRQGVGQAGNVRADQLTQLATRPLGLNSASNPVAAQGGSNPEPAGQARRTIPLGTRTLGRAVSLLDYEDFALAFAGIAKARAQVLQLAGRPTIVITVAGQDGAVLPTVNPVWNNLRLALEAAGDPHVTVALLSYEPRTFLLVGKVKPDPAYELKPLLVAVEAALRAYYSFDSRSLAQPVLQSEAIAVVHSVPGVVAVDLDLRYGGTSPVSRRSSARQTRLLAAPMRVSGGVALPAELLTLDAVAFDRLEELA